jgi:hypothetical protein
MEWHFLGIRLAAMRVTDLSTKLLPPGTLYSFTLSYFHYEFDTPAATCKNQDARIYRAFHSYPLLLFYLLHSCLPTYILFFFVCVLLGWWSCSSKTYVLMHRLHPVMPAILRHSHNSQRGGDPFLWRHADQYSLCP